MSKNTYTKLLTDSALVIREQNLGVNHPHSGTTYEHLAMLYSTVERYEEAESFCLKAIDIRKRTFGPDHLSVARTLELHAILLRKLKRETEAREIEARIKIIQNKKVDLGSL